MNVNQTKTGNFSKNFIPRTCQNIAIRLKDKPQLRIENLKGQAMPKGCNWVNIFTRVKTTRLGVQPFAFFDPFILICFKERWANPTLPGIPPTQIDYKKHHGSLPLYNITTPQNYPA